MPFDIRGRIRDLLYERAGFPSIPRALKGLASCGFSPRLVFDVGAHKGEFAALVLSLWPEARVACFEPRRASTAEIARLRERFANIELFENLVGASEKPAVEMHIEDTSSSILRDAHNAEAPVEAFPQITLDSVVQTRFAGQAPDLLKIDVQGYELEVLKGCEKSVGHVRAIVTELNLLDLHEGVPLLHEMVGWLAARGFVPYDVCGLTRRPLDNALWQMDMVFVRKDDALRRDKGYYPGRSWFR